MKGKDKKDKFKGEIRTGIVFRRLFCYLSQIPQLLLKNSKDFHNQGIRFYEIKFTPLTVTLTVSLSLRCPKILCRIWCVCGGRGGARRHFNIQIGRGQNISFVSCWPQIQSFVLLVLKEWWKKTTTSV